MALGGSMETVLSSMERHAARTRNISDKLGRKDDHYLSELVKNYQSSILIKLDVLEFSDRTIEYRIAREILEERSS